MTSGGGHARGAAARDHHPPPRARHRGRGVLQRVPRPRRGVRRGARVPAGRRHPHHRLERHRAHRLGLRQALPRGARAHRAVRGRPERLGRASAAVGRTKRDLAAEVAAPCWRSRPRATTTASARCSPPTGSSTTSRPRKGRRHALRVISELLAFEPARRRHRPRRSRSPTWSPMLRRRAVIFLRLRLPGDRLRGRARPPGAAARRDRGPARGPARARAARRRTGDAVGSRERGLALVDTGDRRVRAEFRDRAESSTASWSGRCRRAARTCCGWRPARRTPSRCWRSFAGGSGCCGAEAWRHTAAAAALLLGSASSAGQLNEPRRLAASRSPPVPAKPPSATRRALASGSA